MKLWQLCPLCNGTGNYFGPLGGTISTTCPICNGKRIIETPDNEDSPWMKPWPQPWTPPWTPPPFVPFAGDPITTGPGTSVPYPYTITWNTTCTSKVII